MYLVHVGTDQGGKEKVKDNLETQSVENANEGVLNVYMYSVSQGMPPPPISSLEFKTSLTRTVFYIYLTKISINKEALLFVITLFVTQFSSCHSGR